MSDVQPAPWAELVRRIQQGEANAEEELVSFFHPRVRAIAAVRLHDPEVAEEIAQEAVLVVLRAVREAKLEAPEKLAAFVLGTARNLVNNFIRTRSQRPSEVPLDPETPDLSTSPDPVAQERQRLVVRAALKRLKALDRRILLLTLVDGMHPREIASVMGMRPKNVRDRKSRAVKAVREEIRKTRRKLRQNHMIEGGGV